MLSSRGLNLFNLPERRVRCLKSTDNYVEREDQMLKILKREVKRPEEWKKWKLETMFIKCD